MTDRCTYFITWTTYGTWLPGDARGWKKAGTGQRVPQPRLEEWCREKMTGTPITLNEIQRKKVEVVCREHAEHRRWDLHAVSARSNHVHLAVTADKPAEVVRDQFKANATRVLKSEPSALKCDKVWTRGGDTQVVDGESALEQVMVYILEGQDRMGREE